jgi:hypothetical protein
MFKDITRTRLPFGDRPNNSVLDSPNWDANRNPPLFKKLPAFMDHESSLKCSKVSIIDQYPKQVKQ